MGILNSNETIDFIDNEAFGRADSNRPTLPIGCSIYADRDADCEQEVDSVGDFEYLRDLPLLSPEGEAFLFHKMNFIRHEAEQLRKEKHGTADGDRAVQQLLEDADSVRNHIAECNLRLVISIARKFATGHTDFDELMSEGNEILLKAIGKFDFSRGYRFSTYATHSVQRHFFRYTQKMKKRHTKEFKSTVEVLNEVPGAEMDESIAYWIREEGRMTNLIARMADRLDEREQRIIVERFGLAKDGVSRTLRELSHELGLSKERIRQLQIIAVDKLRDLFDELDPELTSA